MRRWRLFGIIATEDTGPEGNGTLKFLKCASCLKSISSTELFLLPIYIRPPSKLQQALLIQITDNDQGGDLHIEDGNFLIKPFGLLVSYTKIAPSKEVAMKTVCSLLPSVIAPEG